MNNRLNHLLINLDKVEVDKYPKGQTVYHPVHRMCVRHKCIICVTFGHQPDERHDKATYELAQKVAKAKGISVMSQAKRDYYKAQTLEYGANLNQANSHVLDYYRKELK